MDGWSLFARLRKRVIAAIEADASCSGLTFRGERMVLWINEHFDAGSDARFSSNERGARKRAARCLPAHRTARTPS